jgi:hypothetical protein
MTGPHRSTVVELAKLGRRHRSTQADQRGVMAVHRESGRRSGGGGGDDSVQPDLDAVTVGRTEDWAGDTDQRGQIDARSWRCTTDPTRGR